MVQVYLERDYYTTTPVSVNYWQFVNDKLNYLQTVEIDERQAEMIRSIEDPEEAVEFVKQIVWARITKTSTNNV